MGNVATTVSGRTCQAWTSDSPHDHQYDSDSMYPDGSVSAAGNKCRNPDHQWSGGVWCYTTDPDKRWEMCDIPLCCECIPRFIMLSVECVQLEQLQQEHSKSADLRRDKSAPHPESVVRGPSGVGK